MPSRFAIGGASTAGGGKARPRPAGGVSDVPLSSPRLSELKRPSYAYTNGTGSHGEAGLPLQTSRIHLPVLRDLWRYQRVLGLRSPRRRAQEQPPGLLVGVDGPESPAGPGRGGAPDRRARLLDHQPPPGLGSLGARRRIQRSHADLPAVQEALPGRSRLGRSPGERVGEGAPDGVPGREQGLPPAAPARRHALVRVAREEAREGARDRPEPELRPAAPLERDD